VRGTITVKMKSGEQDQVMFLVEGRQAGIFEMKNLPAEAIQHLANVNCPAIVYPYLRANLADIVTRTGLPPVHLPEVNFEGLYQQRLAQANEQAEQQAQAGQA
jgi:preprotein translocase subunit SecB